MRRARRQDAALWYAAHNYFAAPFSAKTPRLQEQLPTRAIAIPRDLRTNASIHTPIRTPTKMLVTMVVTSTSTGAGS